MVAYFYFKGKDECGTTRYIELPQGQEVKGARLIAYPHFHGNSNQQWRWDNGRIISSISPAYCVAVHDVKDGCVVYLHYTGKRDSRKNVQDKWICKDGVIKPENSEDFYLGLNCEKLLLRKERKDHSITTWETEVVAAVMKPAARCDIQYGPITQNKGADAWTLQNTARVRSSSDFTYFCVIGWGPGGYCGLEQIDVKNRIVLFTMWDDGTHKVKDIEKGHGVAIKPFSYSEGSGLRAEKNINWKLNQSITLKVTGVKHTNGNQVMWKCSCWYFKEDNDWNFIASYTRLGNPPFNQHFYSFIDDLEREENCEGHILQRTVEFSQPKFTTSEGVIIDLNEAIFTKRSNDCYDLGVRKAFGAVKKPFSTFLLTTGGNTDKHIAKELETKGYEQICSGNLSNLCL